MAYIIQWLLDATMAWGYAGIVILMAVESSFIPFPSEVVIPPAAFLAARGEFNLFMVIACGIAGSLLGASLNYAIARYLGRAIVYRLAARRASRLLLISPAKLERAEGYFIRYGGVSTFFGRLIPAVRQLISLPAGFARMKFGRFMLFTFLGSGAWVSILALLGYFLGENEAVWHEYYRLISYVLAGLGAIVIIFFIFRRRLKPRRR